MIFEVPAVISASRRFGLLTRHPFRMNRSRTRKSRQEASAQCVGIQPVVASLEARSKHLSDPVIGTLQHETGFACS